MYIQEMVVCIDWIGKDFQSFHAYTGAKKEIEQGQFFTPPEVCEFLVSCIKLGTGGYYL